jgi:HEAT repeat protein
VQAISGVTLVLIALWGVLAYRARYTYVDQFRTKLRNRNAEARASAASGPDPEPEEESGDADALLDALCSHAETKALRALDEIANSSVPVPVDAVLCLLDHPADAVRAEALRVLRVREVPDVGETVAEALRDPDPDVQLEAARYLYCNLTDNHLERLQQGLEHEDPQIQAATVGLIAEEGRREEYELVSERLLRRLIRLDGQRGRESRIQVARILGVLDRPYRNELLHRLLRDEAPEVVRAAITAAGKAEERPFVPVLVQHLGADFFATPAKQALVSYGTAILGTLYDHLIDPGLPRQTRQRIPSIFSARPSPFGLRLLVRSLSHDLPVPVRHAVVRALSKVKTEGDFNVDVEAVETAVEHEIEHFAALGQLLRLHQRDEAAAPPVPPPHLRSFREETLERLFRLLGLRYDHRDIYDAYLGITSTDPSLRDSAVEFVDNLVDYSTRRILLPLLDDPDGKQAVEVGRTAFDLHIQDVADARRYLRTVNDPRLKAASNAEERTSHPEDDRLQATPSASETAG